tara:strand:- start:20245 stop:20643 length:399 start_codon:yes stop_codon:yes gene_type:complete
MKPYYQDDAAQIFHADCRDVLPTLEPVDLVLTDPPYGIGLEYGANYKDNPDLYWEWFLPILSSLRQAAENVVFTHRQAALRYITDWDWIAVWNKPMAFGYAQKGWLNHWEPIFVYGKPSYRGGQSKQKARHL